MDITLNASAYFVLFQPYLSAQRMMSIEGHIQLRLSHSRPQLPSDAGFRITLDDNSSVLFCDAEALHVYIPPR